MAMIQDITIFIILAVGALALIILAGIAAAMVMRDKSPQHAEGAANLTMYVKIFDFAMFVVMGFSLMPILVKVLTDALPQIVKDSPLPQALQQNAMLIAYFFWIIAAGGLAIAFPAMQKAGFFKPEPPENQQNQPNPPAPQAPQN